MRKFAIVIVALVTLAFAANAAAQQPVEYNVTVRGDIVKGTPDDHFLTFNGPFQIPEMTLPAGTYVFSIMSSGVVRVSNADRSVLYAMFFTAPIQRAAAGDEYQMVLTRVNAETPRRISKWFMPNQLTGYEFLYPGVEAAGER